MTDASADPSAIGPFVVLDKLGEGAMGVVYAGYDRSLDRKVALKLVRRQLLDKPAVRTRMTREAQAMARLSNPHVVQVYQVGEHDGGIYVAMEYIDGQTLGQWLRAEPRGWQAVLRVVCEAGRGLAAAHSAGLVHRDFKPDNVLVDARGQARVLDFGLVQAEHHADEDPTETADDAAVTSTLSDGVERSNVHWSVRLTQMGKVLGTPAYMSPEQHFGEPNGPYSDQFSFSVTLYEALYGVRPFVGDTWASIKAQVERGVVPPPPAESRVPRRLFKVVARGLSTAPDRRFASMEEMLAALSHDPGRARVRAAAMVGLIGAASAGSFAVATMGQSTEERCAAGASEIGAVWGDEQRRAVRRAFAQTGLAFAGDVLARAEARLDRYSEAWQAAHAGACQSHASGSISGRMLDLGAACLARNKQHVAALVEILEGADRDVVENAVQAVAALPSVKACEDPNELSAVLPPNDGETAERVETLRERLARARMLEAAGSYADGLTLASKVRGEAKTLGYAPLQAEAALVEGGLLSASARAVEAEAVLSEAMGLGIEHDLHAVAAEAAARRIFVLGDGLGRHEVAWAGETVAAALVERARDDGSLEALLENNLGTVFDLAGDDAAAQQHFERTVTLLQDDGEPGPLLAAVYHNLANLDLERGDLDAARLNSTRAHALFVELLGEKHPMVAHPLGGLGDVALRRGALVEASARYTEALALLEAAYGAEHPYLVPPLTGLGQVAARRGEVAEAKRRFERAVALAERTGYDVHPLLAEAFIGLGELGAAEGETQRALLLFERAVKAYGSDRTLGLSAALRAGEMAAKLGDTAAAIGWFERVLAATPGPAAGDERRLTATLSLARVLAGRGEARPRVCELLTEARAALSSGDERRQASDAVFVASCGPS